MFEFVALIREGRGGMLPGIRAVLAYRFIAAMKSKADRRKDARMNEAFQFTTQELFGFLF